MIKKVSISLALLSMLIYGLWELHNSRTFQVFGQLVSSVGTEERVIALTFDDGPTARHTESVLTILRERDVKATFFVTGSETKSNLYYAERIVQEGHELGNHSFSHPRMVFKGWGTIRNEIEQTDIAIRSAGYEGPIYFRPPYGKKLFLLPWYLSKNNRTTIMWDLEPESYSEIASSSDRIVGYVLENVQPGSILLLHVMYDSREESRKALPVIIDRLREEGYSFRTISELLNNSDA